MNLRDHAIAQHSFVHIERALLVLAEASWWIRNRDALSNIRTFERIAAAGTADALDDQD